VRKLELSLAEPQPLVAAASSFCHFALWVASLIMRPLGQRVQEALTRLRCATLRMRNLCTNIAHTTHCSGRRTAKPSDAAQPN